MIKNIFLVIIVVLTLWSHWFVPWVHVNTDCLDSYISVLCNGDAGRWNKRFEGEKQWIGAEGSVLEDDGCTEGWWETWTNEGNQWPKTKIERKCVYNSRLSSLALAA